MRKVSWFSCGAASAVATKLALENDFSVLPVRIVLDNEHQDNTRFADDCADWFGKPILELRSERYQDCWDVWEKRRYLNGPAGALCTVELKKKVRQQFQKPGDVQVFGFTVDEIKRAKRFNDNNPEASTWFPLIDQGYNKTKCFEVVASAGIELPAMYRLGYHNANCVGCVKGGMGYWNKIREDFPEVFNRMALLERQIGASCMSTGFLDELKPNRGRHKDLELSDCGIACETSPAEQTEVKLNMTDLTENLEAQNQEYKGA